MAKPDPQPDEFDAALGELQLSLRRKRPPNRLHARGLLRVRQGRLDDALVDLERSARLAPGVPRHAYVRAVARNSAGDAEGAIGEVLDALERQPYDRELLSLAVSLLRDAGRIEEAGPFERRLRSVSAGDPGTP